VTTRTTQRVGRELRDRLASILETRVSDPRLEGVSIMEVRLSPDLSFARVFYRTWRDPQEVDAALQKAKPFLRRCLGETLQLRRVPELDLRLDPTAQTAARMEEVLKELADERELRTAETPETPEAPDVLEGPDVSESGGEK